MWDSRNLAKAVNTHNLDSSTGIIQPLYDGDAKMLFLAGKGDGNIRVYEVTDTGALMEINSFVNDQPTKSAALLPKRSLDVMSVEVNRVLKLTASGIMPVKFTVPRKVSSSFIIFFFHLLFCFLLFEN